MDTQKIIKSINVNDDKGIFEICCYGNGNRARCTSFSKIRYFFNEDGSIKEIKYLNDDEFRDILIEEGIDPNKPYGSWMIMPNNYV